MRQALLKNIFHKTIILPLLYDFLISDHLILGKLVEIFGNRQTLDGSTFELKDPQIATAMKSRFILNRYEKEEREAAKKYFDSKTPIVEFGGCIGVISCILNKKLVNKKNHVVVEANPNLIPLIEENKRINKGKFIILNFAVGYGKKTLRFYLHEKFVGGSAQRKTDKPIIVKTISLKNIIKSFGFKKINLVCDIEGGEIDLINYEIDILKKYVKYFVVEIHPAMISKNKIDKAINLLLENNFKKVYFKRQVAAFRNNNL